MLFQEKIGEIKMKRSAILIGLLTMLISVALAAPVLAVEIKTEPTINPTITPDSQMQQEEIVPKEGTFVLPEYPLLGGVVAILACFAALAVYKGARLHKQKP
jgi:hypothetical protein